MKIHSILGAAALLLMASGLSAPAWSGQEDQAWEKVVFHVDESGYARWVLMLAGSYLDDSPKAKLAVVAYGPGVDFLLDGAEDKHGSPYDADIMALEQRGAAFRVCGTTLKARGIAPDRLVEGVDVVPSGIAEIARLQLKEGFAYLKP